MKEIKSKLIKKIPPFDLFKTPRASDTKEKDVVQTYAGFICSILMTLSVTATSIFFFVKFVGNAEVTTNYTVHSSKVYPTLNLYDNKFFIVIDFKEFSEQWDYEEIKKEYMEINSYFVTQQKGVRKDRRKKAKLVSCDKIKVDLSYSNLIGQLSHKQLCIEFDKSSVIRGTQGDDIFTYLEVRFEICDYNKYPLCVPRNPTASDKITDAGDPKGLKAAFERFQDLIFELTFIDAGVEVGNYDKPILYTLNSNNQLRANLYSEKIYDYYLGEVVVKTRSGWFDEHLRKESALRLAGNFFDSTWREPSVFEALDIEDGEDTNEPGPYATARFMVSNQIMTVERDYQNVIDCFSNVGGIASSISTICVFIMFLHNQVTQEQERVNEMLLQNEGQQTNQIKIVDKMDSESRELNQKKVLKTQEEQNEQKTNTLFSYMEIVCYKYFCCKRKTQRYKDYVKCCDRIKNRQELKSMLSKNGNLNVLSQVLLDPYQLKLITALQQKSEEKLNDAEKITVENAVRQLHKRQTDQQTDLTDVVRRRVDQFILERMSRDYQMMDKSISKISQQDDEPVAYQVNRDKRNSITDIKMTV